MKNIYSCSLSLLLFSFTVMLLSSCGTTQSIKDGSMAFQQKSYALAAALFKTEFNEESEPKQKAQKAFMAGEVVCPSGAIGISKTGSEAQLWIDADGE